LSTITVNADGIYNTGLLTVVTGNYLGTPVTAKGKRLQIKPST